MKIDFFTNLESIYNISVAEIKDIFLEIIQEKYKLGNLFINTKGQIIEEYFNQEGVKKSRKVRLTKKHYAKIRNQFFQKLLYYSNLKYKEYLKKQYPYGVIRGEIVDKTKQYYIVKLKNESFRGYLPFKKAIYTYEIGEENWFHISKIRISKELKIMLDEVSDELNTFLVETMLSGFLIKKIRFFKDFIKIKTIPKLPKEKIELLKITFKKKVFVLKGKNEKN
jgi:phosphoribosylformylglycinamidine (FGAM) synthase PurS component